MLSSVKKIGRFQCSNNTKRHFIQLLYLYETNQRYIATCWTGVNNVELNTVLTENVANIQVSA